MGSVFPWENEAALRGLLHGKQRQIPTSPSPNGAEIYRFSQVVAGNLGVLSLVWSWRGGSLTPPLWMWQELRCWIHAPTVRKTQPQDRNMALTDTQVEAEINALDKAMAEFHKKWDIRDKEYNTKLAAIEKEFVVELTKRKHQEALVRKEMDQMAAEDAKAEQEREKQKEEWKKNKHALLKDVADLQKEVATLRKELDAKYLTDADLKPLVERLKKLEAKK